jgi:hypothetical protein
MGYLVIRVSPQAAPDLSSYMPFYIICLIIFCCYFGFSAEAHTHSLVLQLPATIRFKAF